MTSNNGDKVKKKGLVVAGLAGGSGKSVVSVGLVTTLARRGEIVVPFKKGPDYIDAGWLAIGAGRSCYNLDPYLMDDETILHSFATHADQARYVIVEGNRGLYDGVDAAGRYSTAELAKTLGLPVLLVVNCTKTTRTIAALVMGCQVFDREVVIGGVVLNQVATERQRKLVSEAVENYTGIPVVGAIPRLKRDIFPMRHLGMVPHQEYTGSSAALEFLAELVTENVALDRVEEMMADIDDSDRPPVPAISSAAPGDEEDVVIGVLQDAAFQFYYPDNLEALEREGARLVYIDALGDKGLPENLDGLYIGGGFPETSAAALTANRSFRESVRLRAEAGLPVYAECGGLIYLGESIIQGGEEYPLVGLFPIRFGMSQKPQAHGYTVLEVDGKNPFYANGVTLKGHEFRYSTVLEWRGAVDQLALKMVRGHGFQGRRDGLVYKNVLAMYTHVHAAGTAHWARGLVRRCRQVAGAATGR